MRYCRSFIVIASLAMMAPPAMAEPKGPNKCEDQHSKCWDNADQCANKERCLNRCDQKLKTCLNAGSTHGSGGRSTKGTNPDGGKTGATPPTRYPTNNPPSGSVKSPGQFPTGGAIYRKK
jgi:hypothetical protein